MKKNTLLTTKQASKMVNLSMRQVQLKIRKGELKAIQVGRYYFIEEKDLKNVHRQRRPKS